MLLITNLTCEHATNPIGLCVKAPRFSWKIKSDEKNVFQTAYHIEVSRGMSFTEMIWDSGKVHSDQSVLVEYRGLDLGGCEKYYFRAKLWDNHDNESDWSETAFFVTAFDGDWIAKMITGETDADADKSAGTLFRKSFDFTGEIESAFMFASACGIYKVLLNGRMLGENVLAPGWTEYNGRILFQTYDVTDIIKQGGNAVGSMVGAGWYKGDLASWSGENRNIYGRTTGFIMQLVIKRKDGSMFMLCTDENWKFSPSPVTYSEIYHGEVYDARLEQLGFDTYEFDDGSWNPVLIKDFNNKLLIPQDGPFITKHERLSVAEMITTPKGETVLDFGQNITGWINFRVRGNGGDVVELSHAEILDENGNFYTANLRTAKQKIHYTLKGGGTENYEPNFTFQGFRYVRIDRYPGNIDPADFTAVVIHSDMECIGTFKSSHQKLNKLVDNIRWSMKGNFLDIPTDCPQRDERLGWTGDAQVFSRTACYLMDVAGFFTKWLRDVSLSQLPCGGIPVTVPDVLTQKGFAHSSSCWGDAAVVCPWIVYLYSGDTNILKNQYESMKKWVRYITDNSQNGLIWNTGFHYGDWIALDAKEGSYFGATPVDMISTAYYAYSTSLLAKTARVLGETQDAEKYEALMSDIKSAYADEFFTPSGRIAARTQTAYAISLYFDLVPPQYLKRTVADFVSLLKENNNKHTTGFLGASCICHALALSGRLDLAYGLLLDEDYPGWLYPLSKGATTIWEHWDGIKPDNTRWSDDMNSFNHYAYGAVGDFIFSVVAGIDTSESEPGYKHSIIAPQPGGDLKYAEASLETPYGELAVNWWLEDRKFCLSVKIPHNTTANVILPFVSDIGDLEMDSILVTSGNMVLLGSGDYCFRYNV